MELEDSSTEDRSVLSPERLQPPLVPASTFSEAQSVPKEAPADELENDENIPQNSASLSRWEQKIRDFEARQAFKKSRAVPSCTVPGPSPVSSRTRTGLKRSSSFSCEDENQSRVNYVQGDRMSVSLRKALNKRKSRDAPQVKRGKRDVEEAGALV